MPDFKVFDGHNDVLSELYAARGARLPSDFLTGLDGHIDLPRARAGGFAGGFFAVWIPTSGNFEDIMEEMRKSEYDVPVAEPVPQNQALPVAMSQVAILHKLEALGALQICTSVADIEACRTDGTIAAILHMEGAEAIDPDFDALYVLHRAGLRSIGPVWSRNTIFAEGVPFRFPSRPDIGGGLTANGRRFVETCNRLGLLIDLAHLNEAGFWDIAKLSDTPLVATHSNAHAVCPHSRNLTDDQLKAIGESGGMVGLNFATALLREDGAMIDETPVEVMLRHLDHMIALAGEDCVGLGSDFDGAVVPSGIKDVSGLPLLLSAMQDHGFSEELMEKLCFGNWMRVLERTWKA